MMQNDQNRFNDDNLHNLAAIIQGASNSKSSREARIAFGSSVLNRIDSGRPEFGVGGIAPTSVGEVIYSDKSPYYEVNGKNERFNNAMSGNIQPYNEKEYKQSLQLARGLLDGSIERSPGEFFIKDSEKKNASIDFKQLNKLNKVDDFSLYSYKKPMKNNYGKRVDGTPKGEGYFGELKRPDGKISTELSIGVNLDGQETEIPALVPTLDKKEIAFLLAGNKPTDKIIKKAVDHAKKRMSKGLSPFK